MNQVFRINKNLSLKLEQRKTNIYIKDRLFKHCKFLLLNIPVEEMTSLSEIDSIDEVAEKLDNSQELIEGYITRIPPEVEFWGHCSNMQVWYEHNYDTRLLKNNLVFPLLKKLSEVGDPLAKQVFKEEIAKRLESKHYSTIIYLVLMNYLEFLSQEEINTINFKLRKEKKTFNDHENLKFLLRSLDQNPDIIIKTKEMIFLIEHPTIRLLDSTIKLGNMEGGFEIWFSNHFKRLYSKRPKYVEELIFKKLRTCNIKEFINIISLKILDYVNIDKFTVFLLTERPFLINKLKKLSNNNDWVFMNEFFENLTIIKYKRSLDEILKFLETGNIDDLRLIIKLRYIESLNANYIISCLNNSKINLLENLLELINEFLLNYSEQDLIKGVNPDTFYFSRLLNVIYNISIIDRKAIKHFFDKIPLKKKKIIKTSLLKLPEYKYLKKKRINYLLNQHL